MRVDVTNMRATGTIKLVKTGPEDEAIVGAVFGIYGQTGTEITEIVTDGSGIAVFDLPTGDYYVVEKSAPQGYKLDTAERWFTVKTDETTLIEITNEAVKGTVEVRFRHVQDGHELAAVITFTGNLGTDYREWMRENGLEEMEINDYRLYQDGLPGRAYLYRRNAHSDALVR